MAKVVVLDAGHGLSTAGKRTMNGFRGVIQEWTLNNKVCNIVMNILQDYDVIIYRTDDVSGANDVSLSERVSQCNTYQADLFLSIHHNAGGGTGTEIYYHTYGTSEDKAVASLMAPKVATNCGMKNRGVKTAEFTVLTCKATAILIEGGFMDTASDYSFITSEEGQFAYAQAVAAGIIDYLSLSKKQTSPTRPETTLYYRVVVGSYKTKANAEDQQTKLKAKGFESFLTTFTKDKTVYYRVVAGSYTSKLNAQAQQHNLQTNGFDCFLVAESI